MTQWNDDDSSDAEIPGFGGDAVGPNGEPPTLPMRERRTAPRFIFQVPVLIRIGHQSGRGKVHDMSSTGVRVEKSNLEPTEGARIKLGFRFFENSRPVELGGHVVRKTETGGFCVHFSTLDPRTRRALTTLLPKVATGRFEESSSRLYSGELLTNLGPQLHRACADAASVAGISLNEWIKERLEAEARRALVEARSASEPASPGTGRNPYRR